jgi:hypothetical protein
MLFSGIANAVGDPAADDVEEIAWLADFGRRNWNTNKPAAMIARTTVIQTSLRPV